MNKKMDIHCDGKRQYQFVADTAYIREAGTDGEKAAQNISARSWERIPELSFSSFLIFRKKKRNLLSQNLLRKLIRSVPI